MDRENTLSTEIRRLESDLRDFKAAQILGSSSAVANKIQTNNQWDMVLTTGSSGMGFNYIYSVVKFTAEKQIAPFADLSIIATIDGVPVDLKAAPNGTKYININQPFLYNTDPELQDSTSISYIVQCGSDVAGTVFRFKFIMYATDRGTITYRVAQ